MSVTFNHNRKSHTDFRLIPTSMTLNGVIGQILRFSQILVALPANYVIQWLKIDLLSVNIISVPVFHFLQTVYTNLAAARSLR